MPWLVPWFEHLLSFMASRHNLGSKGTSCRDGADSQHPVERAKVGGVRLSVCLFCLSVCLSVCLSALM
jgi:hypothetical protein